MGVWGGGDVGGWGSGGAGKSPSWHNTLSSAALSDSDSREFVGEFVHGAKSREVVNASASRAGYVSLPLLEEAQVEGEASGGACGGGQINQRVLAGVRSMRLSPPPTGPPKGGGIEGSLIDLSEPASVEAATQDEWDGSDSWGLQGLQGKQGMSGLQGAGAQEPLSHGSDGLGDWGRAAGGGRAAVGGRLNGESGGENEKKRNFSAHVLARVRWLARAQSIREVRNCNRSVRPLAVSP